MAQRASVPQVPEDPAHVILHLTIEEPPGRWVMEEEDVPERPLHDAIIETLVLVLKEWARTGNRDALICSNLGCRWDPADARVGIDPDVVLVEPAPPEGELLTTLRVWEPAHVPPRVAVEVVSEYTAAKDYFETPARAARLGVRELWVFDPLLLGPTETGGPHRLQLWRAAGERLPDGRFAELQRVYAGSTPAYSEELQCWLVASDGGARLRLAEDPGGGKLWPTRAETEAARYADATERARAEAERARAEAERACVEAERARAAEERANMEADRARMEAGRAREAEARAASAEAELARLRKLVEPR